MRNPGQAAGEPTNAAGGETTNNGSKPQADAAGTRSKRNTHAGTEREFDPLGRSSGGASKKPSKPPDGWIMRDLLDTHFRLIRSTDGRMFGVPLADPSRAIQHTHRVSPLIRVIAREFLDSQGRWPSSAGVSECASYALAMCDDAPVVSVPLRCYWDRRAHAIYLDTCDDRDTVLRVDAEGVRPVDRAPVPFRRPAVTAPLPWTIAAGSPADFAPLWDCIPIAVDDQPVVLALLISAWLTEVAQPVVLLTGTQDSGKTTAARHLLDYVDPVPAQRGGGLPTDEREWKARIATSRVVLVDNASEITPESADLLCRVATGGEFTVRELYTDDTAHITSLYVPVWLTSIDPGVLRGDLASRIIKIKLTALSEGTRLAESELANKLNAIRPGVTRGLLWLTSQVLHAWPTVDKTRLPHRMGDFAITLRCVDQLLGTSGEKRIADVNFDLAADVVDGSPLAQGIIALVNGSAGPVMPTGRVTPTELLDLLRKVRPHVDPDWTGKGWPKTAKILSAALTRLEPALRQSHGIVIERGKTMSTRWLRVHRVDDTGDDPGLGA